MQYLFKITLFFNTPKIEHSWQNHNKIMCTIYMKFICNVKRSISVSVGFGYYIM